MGLGVIIIFPILFYGLIFFSVKVSLKNYELNINKFDLIFSFLIFSLLLSFCYFIIKKNDFIYFWDFGREWRLSLSVLKGLSDNPYVTLKNVYYTINNSDYNNFMPILMLFPLNFIRNSFKACVFLCELFYMCPAIFIISLLIKKCFAIIDIKNVKFYIIVFFVGFMPILHYVVFDGFIDPPILIIIASILLLSIDIDYKKINIRESLLLGLLLTLLPLFRRHFAYFVVGFLVSQLFYVVNLIIFDKAKYKEIILGYIKNNCIICGTALVITIPFFKGFLKRAIFNNYRIAYKAYDSLLLNKIIRHIQVFGLIVLIMAFFCTLLYVYLSQNKKAWNIVCTLFINVIVTTGLLWRVLQMNWHQYYLIIVQILILASIGVWGLFSIKKNFKNCYISLFIVILSIINYCAMFIPLQNLPCKFLFTSKYYYPKIRHDKSEMMRMVNKLREISFQNPKDYFYVLSSSEVLNSDIIATSLLPSSLNALPQMYWTHDIDLRDGFEIGFLYSDYVIVTDPVQTHAPKGTQHLITYLAEKILDSNSVLGKHYYLIETYQLDYGVSAKLYKKITPLDGEVLDDLINYYSKVYPDQKELFYDRLVNFKNSNIK